MCFYSPTPSTSNRNTTPAGMMMMEKTKLCQRNLYFENPKHVFFFFKKPAVKCFDWKEKNF